MIKNIAKMLPFLESEDLYELAQEILNGNVDMDIVALFPFMDEEDIDKICVDLANNPEWAAKVNMVALYPFASDEYVDKLLEAQAKQGKIDKAILPFVSVDGLHSLVLMYIDNPTLNLDLDELYPFLDSDDISLLFQAYLKNNKKHKGQN